MIDRKLQYYISFWLHFQLRVAVRSVFEGEKRDLEHHSEFGNFEDNVPSNTNVDSTNKKLIFFSVNTGFFPRFCGFKSKKISETLSLGEKSLS